MNRLLSTGARSGIAALALITGISSSNTVIAANSDALIGNWKLASWHVVVGNETQNPFGSHPRGYLLLTREGRAMAITIAEDRTPGEGVAERAALHKSMLAYSGRYRIEGDDFITTVDVSWNEIWNGSEQRRHYRIEGNRLFIESAPAPSILYPGKTDFRRIVWEREK
jgi:Lipocalin-like domain